MRVTFVPVISNIECALPRPDIGELHDQVAAELSKRLLGGAPVLPGSTEDVIAFVVGGAVNLMFGAVAQALVQNDPTTMCCDNLVTYGARRGIDLRGSTRAKGYVAVTGDPDAPIPPSIRFVGASSREYKPDPGVTSNPQTLDETGRAAIRTVAAGSGAVFNLAAGEVVTVTTTIPGIDMDATVVGNGLTGGTDDETCDTLRARIVASESSETVTTNEQWFLTQSLRYPGVTRACTDDCHGCCDPTYIAIYPFFEGVYGSDYRTEPFGVPPCSVLDEMTEWMWGTEPGRGEGLAPVGLRGAFQKAFPTVMGVSAKCLAGCPLDAENRIQAALWPFLRASFCVGSTICKEQIRSEVMKALGPFVCISDIELSFDGSIGNEDSVDAFLACGHFVVLGEIDLKPGFS